MSPARSFSDFAKNVTSTQVHTPTAARSRTFGSFVEELNAKVEKRALHPHDGATAKTPFLYDVNSLGSLRPDQVPRFFGALTDSDKLPDAEIPMDSLIAMQDRVDPAKVEAIRANGGSDKKPVVVRNGEKHFIADGHHRLTADWLDGKTTASVKLKDLTDVSNVLKGRDDSRTLFKVAKADDSLGIVFGWAVVCKENGQDYFDWNVDHKGEHAGKLVPENITEDAMLKASADFMDTERAGNEQHDGPDVGKFLFGFPLTTDIAKAMGIDSDKTGFMVGYKPPRNVLAKFLDGTYSGFSIEGFRTKSLELHA